ncbi:MAG TPA: hypothetical protein VIL74_15215 [Pyrinomonadaceae bacterium]|jgi:hypothetical protein
MKRILKSKLFIGTFLLIYFSFFILTIYVWEIKTGGAFAGSSNYGFPFTYYRSHCFGGSYNGVGMIGNILFAGILGVAGGVIFTFLWRNHLIPFYEKAASEEFRAKWRI